MTPVFFAHSGRSAYERGEGFICSCVFCNREITAPWEFQKTVVSCLYCGFERGLVPEIEVQGGLEYTFGITATECKHRRDAPIPAR